MKPEIKFYVQNKFGKKLYWPACAVSESILKALAVKYIIEKRMNILREGFDVVELKKTTE